MANVEKKKNRFVVYRDKHCLCEVNTILHLLLTCVVRMALKVGYEQIPANTASSMPQIKIFEEVW